MRLRVTKGENPKKPWLVNLGEYVIDSFATHAEAWTFAVARMECAAMEAAFVSETIEPQR